MVTVQQCRAQAKSSGERCRRPAVLGGAVCRLHGGAAPQVAEAGRRRAAEAEVMAEARKALARLDIEPVDDPYRALQRVAGELLALKDRLRAKVEDLEQIRYRSVEGSEQVRAELSVYTQCLRDSVHALATLARLGLDDRVVRIKEAQALLVVQAVQAGIRAAGCTPAQALDARKSAARILQLVERAPDDHAELIALPERDDGGLDDPA